MLRTADIQKRPHQFLPTNFELTQWESLEPYFKTLLDREITSKLTLESWLQDLSELEAFISEDACWRQIKMTCDTESKELEERFNYFMLEIQPHVQVWSDKLNRKLVDCPFTSSLDAKKYFTFLRSIRKQIDLFREPNIPLIAALSVLQQQFGVIAGKMTVTVNGNEYTLQQAAKFLEDENRSVREEVYRKIAERRYQDQTALTSLFEQLLEKRNTLAANAGFTDYVQYRFLELGRFDYNPEMCVQFHDAVRDHVMPLVNELYERKRKKLGLTELRPWDLEAEPSGTAPLRPFGNGVELTKKTIACLTKLRPFFGDCLNRMQQMGHLDLDSRKGKAPGGYNCPLAESGAPFIFMNAVGSQRDLVTMVHEGGHAVHSFLSRDLPITGFKNLPSEVAELASMSMELISMTEWNEFYKNDDDLNRAKKDQLESVLKILPWIAQVDEFQHWIYENPAHSRSERMNAWNEIQERFGTGLVDYTDLEFAKNHGWHRQLHIFEVPFYYIEYGIAQLGAIGMWMQFKKNPEAALNNYCKALSLGGTKTLPQLYEAAGLSFDFSPNTIKVLMEFVQSEMKNFDGHNA